ncbi:MAG: adenylosuccinate lyase [Nitrospinota bacterium]|nr:adenylosuccinate lyase [Nitrospinota bacterium]
MISRYTQPEMQRIWNLENRYGAWMNVELMICEAWAEEGVIPQEALRTIRWKASFDIDRVAELEGDLRHDMLAFLSNLAENVGEEARYIHLGVTSSDVVDTAQNLLMVEAMNVILEKVDKLLVVLKRQAMAYKDTVCIGRTHGVHGEPTTFGLKIAVWYSEMQRNKERLERARETVRVGMISGAVGTYATIPPSVEKYTCEKLGLKTPAISTQVLQRDRHSEYLSALAITAGTLEKMAVEVRHLQRTEVLEAEEPFTEGQKGSSAMPHKRNPVTAENITGLSRVVKANAQVAFDNQALWHERDISHSSAERVVIPDSTTLVDTMLHKMIFILDGLNVYPDRMLENMERTNGLIFSQRMLLELTQTGMSREDAYMIVQRAAMRCWKEKAQFMDLLLAEPKVRGSLSKERIEECFDITYYLKHVDYIFKQVFGE